MFYSRLTKVCSLLFISGFLLSSCGVDDNDDPDIQDEEAVAPETEASSASDEIDDETDDDNNNEADVETSTGDNSEAAQDLNLWFPKYESTLLDYEGFGNEFAAFTRYPQFVHETTMQVVDSSGGTDVVRVFEYSENAITEIFTRGETYFRDDVLATGLDSMEMEDDILLQLPIEVGHSWDSTSSITSEITDTGFEFETEFGTFNAIEVTRSEENFTSLYYFAEGIGLVEQVFNPGEDPEMAITSTLVSRSENQAQEIYMMVFSLNEQADRLIIRDIKFGLFTNEPVYPKLAEIFRGQAPEADITPLISENTDINQMYLGNDEIAYIDFTPELVSEMNAGAGVEALIIQAIVDTVGNYYNVEEVMLTVDGGPYSSGHFDLSEGETWPVEFREGEMK